jgi:hypothetical protein
MKPLLRLIGHGATVRIGKGETHGIRDLARSDESERSARDEFDNNDYGNVHEKSCDRLGAYCWTFTGRVFVA